MLDGLMDGLTVREARKFRFLGCCCRSMDPGSSLFNGSSAENIEASTNISRASLPYYDAGCLYRLWRHEIRGFLQLGEPEWRGDGKAYASWVVYQSPSTINVCNAHPRYFDLPVLQSTICGVFMVLGGLTDMDIQDMTTFPCRCRRNTR